VAVFVTLLLALPLAGFGAAAVEQGTITVNGVWAPGEEPSEAVEACFTLTLDEAGATVVGMKCVTDPYVASFGPVHRAVETGHVYYAWQSLADGTLIGEPQPVTLTDATGQASVDVPLAAPSPAGTGAVEVHVSACPTDIGVRPLYDACHANGYTGDEIILDGPVHQSGVTSGDIGAVRFDGLPAGDYTIAEGQMRGEFERFEVFCSVTGGQIPVEDRSNGRAAVLFTLGADQEVVCDWYNIPVQEQVTTPTATPEPTGTALATMQPVTATGVPQTPTATATGVVVLPSTGTGPLGGGRTMALNLGALIASAMLLAAAGFVIADEHRQR
jgi:hypothetical protein